MAASAENLLLDAGVSIAGEPALQIAVDIHYPRTIADVPSVLFCLPGGGTRRQVFDLHAADGDHSLSLARAMTAAGIIVVLMDPLGVGGSSRPADGFLLTAELLAQAHQRAVLQIQARLKARHAKIFSIGLGHSMGAMLTTLQQARYRPHDALVLLGFTTRGLPQYTPAEWASIARDEATRAERVPQLAREFFKKPYPHQGRSGNRDLYGGRNADPHAASAVRAVTDQPLLPVPALLSMLPDNVAIEAAQIDVPIFVGVGDRDMVGAPHEIPMAFKQCPDLRLIVLQDTGHNPFAFASRTRLFHRLASWIREISEPEEH
jgi:pimeloyl-ACP methyl ester carboxylesterase